MSCSTTAQIWDSLSERIQRSLVIHVKGANQGGRYYANGRWRSPAYGAEAIDRGLIEIGEHPKYYLTELGWELGRYGISLEKGK